MQIYPLIHKGDNFCWSFAVYNTVYNPNITNVFPI